MASPLRQTKNIYLMIGAIFSISFNIIEKIYTGKLQVYYVNHIGVSVYKYMQVEIVINGQTY